MLDLNDAEIEDTVSLLCPQCGIIIDHLLASGPVECPRCDFMADEDAIDWDTAIEKYNQWLIAFIEGGKRE
jgi:hypothetical protein